LKEYPKCGKVALQYLYLGKTPVEYPDKVVDRFAICNWIAVSHCF
jgi:hypothetical protein